MKLEELLSRLQEVRRSGSEWKTLCPAHNDHDPSLSITTGQDGRLLLLCRAGCSTEAVIAALGLTVADLFPEPTGPAHQIAATYDYTTEQGKLLYQAVP